MAEKSVYIVTFDDSRPQWAVFNGKEATVTEPPEGKPDLQVVVLLPERFFFYYLPKVIKSKRERAVRTAALLQMRHFFPSFGEEGTVGILPSVQGLMLGFFAKPELKDFLDEQQDVVSQANVVTTSFALCWDAAVEKRTPCWNWRGEGGEQALFVEDEFQFFRGDEAELRRRLELFQLGTDAPVPVSLGEALVDVFQSKRRWTRYKMPFKVRKNEGEGSGLVPKMAVVITLLGALFIAGQVMRLSQREQTVAQWKERTRELYAQALGPNAGPDPYGKLLSTLDQMNTGSVMGFDAIGLLRAMSADAPDSLLIESMSLSAESGSVSGTIGSYDDLEQYVEQLKQQTEFTFVLEQATSTEDGIKYSFRVAQGQ